MLPGSLGILRNELEAVVSKSAGETQETNTGKMVAPGTAAEGNPVPGSHFRFLS